MPNQIDLNKYQKFVTAVTSRESMNFDDLLRRINELRNTSNVNVSLLMTAGIGLASEGGEFNEIIKKVLFQGKPLTEENVFHMKRELGDIIWYWTNACTALGLDPNEVIVENVNKLESRYPGGQFDAHYSENRKDGDL
jgi:NTP pyrophosphatase (non-canonical NTP hydrolase)